MTTPCAHCPDPATNLLRTDTPEPLCDRHQARHDHPSAFVRPVRVATLRSAS